MFNFEKLSVYKKSLNLANEIYTETSKWPKEYLFSLTDQIRRASLSMSLNIAEGSAKTKKDFRRFLGIARGSCFECIPLIDMAYKRKLITGKQKEIWYNQLAEIAKMLSGLRSKLLKSNN